MTDDFLIKNYSLLTYAIEFLAALTGILLLKSYKLSNVKYFIFFLCFLTIGDISNSYTSLIRNNGILSFLESTVFINNYWWSTLYWKIGAILFFVFYFRKILKTEVFRKTLKFSGFIFLIISIACIVINWEHFFSRFFPIISIMGALIIFLCTSFYFFEVLKSDKILTFYKTINFYISGAIFIWWLIITPIVFYDIYGEHRDMTYINLRRYIYLFANLIMYSTFTFALIWCKPQND
ncbi:hypothetical protein [Litoribaculum gwangyangense]|uniref:Uncharacterized protein n=1 Tax=Litoribaculum gwangyangense TaxID=1130722 RepID=A0ABP9CIG1_9FLAO